MLLQPYNISSFPSGTPDPHKDFLLLHTTVPEVLPVNLFLSAQEIEKSRRFVKEDDRMAFSWRHHLLRQQLSHWIKEPPLAINLEINPFGKPSLPGDPFQFSMSRSFKFLGFCFGPFTCGVDIEQRRPSSAYRAIAEQHFHPNEQKAIKSDDDFFMIWTRKEALLKALGTGITSTLAALDCTGEIIQHPVADFHLYSFYTGEVILSLATPVSAKKASIICL